MAVQQASGRFEEFIRQAATTSIVSDSQFYVAMAQADALARIGDLLEELAGMVKEEVDVPGAAER